MQVSHFLKRTVLIVMSTAAALLLADFLMDSVSFSKNWLALIAAVVMALLNMTLKPLLFLLTIPVTIFTLGLFLLVINTVILMIADQLVDGFQIEGFWAAFVVSLFISFMNSLIQGNIRIEKYKIDQEN